MFAVAAVLSATAITASQVGVGGGRHTTASPAQASLFAGIPQRGAALGSPHAPVTLIEYADLQCPYCAEWSQEALPPIVADYVRSGRVRIVFNGLAFLGPDSELALRMVVAAGAQNKQWNLLHELYRRQGYENSGWVGDELPGAAAAAGLDPKVLDAAAWGGATSRTIERTARVAHAAGVQGTPSFEVGRTGGPMRLVRVTSLTAAGIRPALDAALAQ
ncbi:MAG TPA: thioredoxin domain-containing protein [Caldimonas sp.]|nr:thioredoxin domain-containing protein [Caldimonas sp.]